MSDLFSLAGRTALITGGSRGIGKMIAAGYIAAGAKVYISARKEVACRETAAELGCTALPADVSVLLIEHDMDLVFSFANRMTVLVNGTVLTEGDPDTIANDAQVKAVYLGHGEGSSDAGPPQGARAPLGGSEPRAAGSVGAGGSHV